MCNLTAFVLCFLTLCFVLLPSLSGVFCLLFFIMVFKWYQYPRSFHSVSHGKLPFPSPGDLPDPGIEPWSPALLADCFNL